MKACRQYFFDPLTEMFVLSRLHFQLINEHEIEKHPQKITNKKWNKMNAKIATCYFSSQNLTWKILHKEAWVNPVCKFVLLNIQLIFVLIYFCNNLIFMLETSKVVSNFLFLTYCLIKMIGFRSLTEEELPRIIRS